MYQDDTAYEIHIQISVLEEETAQRLDFEELPHQTSYCLGYRSDNQSFDYLFNEITKLCASYRESSQLDEREPLSVALWFTTPRFEPDIVFEPDTKVRPFKIIKGGKK